MQPDNESIAYTFRELEPRGGKAARKGGDNDGSDADAADSAAAGVDDSAQGGLAANGSGPDTAVSGAGVSDAAGEVSSAERQPATATGAAVESAHPAEPQPQRLGQPGEAVAALQEAGLLHRHDQSAASRTAVRYSRPGALLRSRHAMLWR